MKAFSRGWIRRLFPARPGPVDPTTIRPAAGAQDEPVWQIESRFLSSFNVFEQTLVAVLSTHLDPEIVQRMDLQERVAFLQWAGILDQTLRNRWATSLRVRKRLLLKEQPRPDLHEVSHALGVMTRLDESLRERSARILATSRRATRLTSSPDGTGPGPSGTTPPSTS